MSVFGTIMNKIFGRKPKAAPGLPPIPANAFPTDNSIAHAPVAMPAVDVEAILTEMAEDNSQKLNWRTSIVDLMKLVGMESSLSERKELAAELGYTGDTNDTATMNVWLHKQVMKKLAENGGKVPASMLD